MKWIILTLFGLLIFSACSNESNELRYTAEAGELTIFYRGHTFDFNWMGYGRQIPPQIMRHDMDGDGSPEIAILLWEGSGTGFSVDDLHVISFQNGRPAIHTLAWYATDLWFAPPIATEIQDDGLTIKITFNGQTHIANSHIKNYRDWENAEFAGFGTFGIVNFGIADSRITSSVGLAAYYSNIGGSGMFYIATVRAFVGFNGESLYLYDYTIEIFD